MTDPLSTLTGLQRGLLSDQIYDLIKNMIKDTTLEPGEQLVESQLARRLQVSQAPVRDALKRLAHEGLVTHVRHQGNFVASYSDEEAEQAKVARAALEGLAGELACGRLEPAVRERLAGLIDQMHAAADARNLPEVRELDFAFHPAVDEARIAGVVVQTRADVGDKSPERIADVLRQRFADIGLELGDDRIRALAAEVSGA